MRSCECAARGVYSWLLLRARGQRVHAVPRRVLLPALERRSARLSAGLVRAGRSGRLRPLPGWIPVRGRGRGADGVRGGRGLGRRGDSLHAVPGRV